MSELPPYEETLHHRLGGQPTIDHAMNVLFDRVLPEHPGLLETFGDRLTDPKHRRQVGFAAGAALGGPGREKSDLVEWVAAQHRNKFPAEVFDETIGCIVEAFEITGEDLTKQSATEQAIGALAGVAAELRPLMTEGGQPMGANERA